MIKERILKQFNWRFLLVRIVVNAFALAGTAAFIPKIYFVDRSLLNWLLMAFMLGLLNALLKPILQFLTLQFIFITYGLVVVLVNALLLWLLALIFPNRFAVESWLWLFVGGLVLGLLSSFLESLLGLTMPIVPDEPPGLREQVEQQAREVEWLTRTSSESALEKQGMIKQEQILDADMMGSEEEVSGATTKSGIDSPLDTEKGIVDSETALSEERLSKTGLGPVSASKKERKESQS